MKRLRWLWILIFAVSAIPYLLLLLFGGIWLWEHGCLWQYFAGLIVLTATAWAAIRYLARPSLASPKAFAFPSPYGSSPLDERARQAVERIARQVETGETPLDSAETAKALLLNLLEAVAAVYHADSRQAVLQVPLPDVLKLVELVTADLRNIVSQKVPGSHVLTVADWIRIPQWWQTSQWGWFLYRLVTIPLAPGTALLRELRFFLLGRVTQSSLQTTNLLLKGYAVRRLGHYAIELYSGRIVAEERELSQFTSIVGRKTADQADSLRQMYLSTCREPYRVLVVGQTKAGKSSCINALIGSPQASVDSVAATEGIHAYRVPSQRLRMTDETGEIKHTGETKRINETERTEEIERIDETVETTATDPLDGGLGTENQPEVYLLDTPGYGDDAGESAFQRLLSELNDCDVLLLVCTARHASRKADREFLAAMLRHFAQNPQEVAPGVIVAGTGIDQLRPLAEWDPPYDPDNPVRPKEKAIAAFLQALAEDLQIPRNRVCGVCTARDRQWNIRGGLLPLLQQALREADPRRRRRHLHGYRNTTRLGKLFKQIGHAPAQLLDWFWRQDDK